MFPGEWVSLWAHPCMGSEVGGEHVQWNSHLIIWINQTKPKLIKKRLWESSDSETEEKPNYFPSFIVMESAEETPLSKLSPFKIEKILSKSLKPKTVKKLKKGTLIIEICNKNQADEILKWKHFDNIKIKTYLYNSLNTCHHHHHHAALLARISLTFSHHPSLSSIAPGRSSRLLPVSAQSCCI